MRRKKEMKALRGPFLHNPRHLYMLIWFFVKAGVLDFELIFCIDIIAGSFCYLGIFMVFVKM